MLVLSAATRRRFDTAGSTELQRRKRRPAWLRPDLVPGKGQFRSRFHHPLSYCCPTTIFGDPRNRHRHHFRQHFWTGGLERLGPVVTMRSRSLMRRSSLNRPEPGQKERPKYPEELRDTLFLLGPPPERSSDQRPR